MKRIIPLAIILTLLATTTHAPAAAPILGQSEREALVTSYEHLVGDFYKKVDGGAAVTGAHDSLIAFLKKKGIANPTISPVSVGADDNVNERELQREVAAAVTTYGAKFGARDLTYAALDGVLGSVKDKYTVFLTPKQFADLNEGLDGGANFGGVGLAYHADSPDDKTVTGVSGVHVENVIPDGPADKAGVLTGDIITAVDGHLIKDLDHSSAEKLYAAITKLLRGDANTAVTLSIIRADGPIAPIVVTRAMIHPPSVYSKLLPSGIGYAQLTVFGQATANELTTALTRLQAQGAKAYILDLRNNGGGYLTTAVDVSSKFVASGPIVSVESRAGNNTEYDAENTAVKPLPLAVLVNRYTASASEITAGAIQDSGVGTLIGEKTYGKGVVQTIFPMRDGSAIKITTQRYFTPHGRDINGVGIQPDVAAVQNKNYRLGDPTADDVLKQAVGFLQGKITALSQ